MLEIRNWGFLTRVRAAAGGAYFKAVPIVGTNAFTWTELPITTHFRLLREPHHPFHARVQVTNYDPGAENNLQLWFDLWYAGYDAPPSNGSSETEWSEEGSEVDRPVTVTGPVGVNGLRGGGGKGQHKGKDIGAGVGMVEMVGGGGTLPSASSAEPGSRSQPGDAEGMEGEAGYTDE